MYQFQVQFPTQCQCSSTQPSALSTAQSKDFSEYAALCSSETESLGTFEVLASLFALPCRLPSQSRPTTSLHPALTQHFHFTQISLPKHLASNPAKPDTESDYSINPETLTLQTTKSFAPDSKPLQFQTKNAQKREESTHTPNSQMQT
jgi:hypothetical protein